MLLAPSKAVLSGETDHQVEDDKPEVRGKQSRRERARAEANAHGNGNRSEPVASAISEDSAN
jgi:hypothetical protein